MSTKEITLKTVVLKDDILTILSETGEKLYSDSVKNYTLRFYDIRTPLIGKIYLEVIFSHPAINYPIILKAKETDADFEKLKDFSRYMKKNAKVDIAKDYYQLTNQKKQVKKGLIYILIILGIIIGGFISSVNSDNIIRSGKYEINGEAFHFSDSVRDDVTDRWRISTTTTSQTATEFAIDYYNTLFSSDDEIHAIVNFSLNTTTSISVIYQGTLDVIIREYVDGEEHNAKTLFGGMLLGEYFINIETGEITEIQ